MALAMSRPFKHPKTGVYWFRRVVPAPLRELIGRTEFKETLGTKDPAEARRRYPVIAAKYDAIIEQARTGAPAELSHQQIMALAGAWYAQRLAEAEMNPPGDAEGLRDLAGDYNAILENGPKSEGRKIIGSEADEVLRKAALFVSKDSREKLADQMFELETRMIWMLAKRADGDYRPDEFVAGIPKFQRETKVSFKRIFEGWAKERQPDSKTLYDWDRQIETLAAFLGHTDASRATEDDIIRWKQALIDQEKSAATINKYLTTARTVFGWAVENKLIAKNPAEGVSVTRRRSAARTRLPFTEPMVRDLLRKASTEDPAIKWTTWLQAYSGDRISSVAQLRKADIKRIDGIWVLDLHADTPSDVDENEVMSQKNPGSVRVVPIHPAVIRAGFLDYVETLKDGPLFPMVKPDRFGKRGGTLSKRYNRWLRGKAGVTDKRYVDHSWRHWFKDFCRNNRIPREVHHRLTGHSLGSEGDDYGEGHSPQALYEWICHLPDLGPAEDPKHQVA